MRRMIRRMHETSFPALLCRTCPDAGVPDKSKRFSWPWQSNKEGILCEKKGIEISWGLNGLSDADTLEILLCGEPDSNGWQWKLGGLK
mmetsp:Transcript_11262/g.26317  ORF Transcript_11262/g.26317 Transcript_11262/m.26317 type:complete len:88 (-) Transcript_11262:142-405(-)